jgi:20S proteasome alpha/beta subunit
LEKSYAETSGRDTIKLAIRALMETVEASSKNIEIAVMEQAGLRWVGVTGDMLLRPVQHGFGGGGWAL